MDAVLDQNTEELSRISKPLVRRFKRAVFLASEIKSRAIFRVRQNIVPDAKGYSAKLLLMDLNSWEKVPTTQSSLDATTVSTIKLFFFSTDPSIATGSSH